MQIVTQTLLELGLSKGSKINESQLVLLDISEEVTEKWQTLVLGKELSDARAELFVLLNGVDDKITREKIIDNYKALQSFRKKQNEPIVEETKPSQNTAVTIYCDGGCTPNPGKAGSGVALYRANLLAELWYGRYETMGTNNTAELGALYESLLLAKNELENGNTVEIKCDSMYSINCIKTWAISWEKKGWTKKGGAIKNLEIIKLCYALYNSLKKDVALTHIKAHAGFEGNELADRMTMYTIQEKSKEFVKYKKTIDIASLLKMRAG